MLAQLVLILRKRKKGKFKAVSHKVSKPRLKGAVGRRAGSRSRQSSQKPLGQETDREAMGEPE